MSVRSLKLSIRHCLTQAAGKNRKSVSQYQQPHVMKAKGLHLLEQLIPGFKHELLNSGAQEMDLIADYTFVSSCQTPAMC